MKRYHWLLIAFAILVIIAMASRILPRDIHADVAIIEGKILSLLNARGITEKSIVSREHDKWRCGNIKGETLAYVFKAGGVFNTDGIHDEVRDTLKDVRGCRLENFVYKDGEDTVGFDVYFRDHAVLSVRIEDINPRIALVLDDFGYTKTNLAALEDIKVPLTLAVLPNTPYSEKVCSFAGQNGKEAILHLPMEPEREDVSLEKDTILVNMDTETIKAIMSRAFLSVAGVKGVSNHMGSRATRDGRVMGIIFEELKKKGMFFLDSMTTDGSLCMETASNAGIPCVKRDIFIDNVLEEETITRQMKKAGEIARLNGAVVAIGHDRSVTVEVLRKVIPRMEKEGILFVTLSEIVRNRWKSVKCKV